MEDLNHIMLVEDEPDIREIATIALADLGGFTVTACDSAKQALEKVEHSRPQLILLDVMMPDMDGPSTFEELKKTSIGKTTPVIFMTARAQTHEIKEYLRLGAIGVITKPFDPSMLKSEIIKIWSTREVV